MENHDREIVRVEKFNGERSQDFELWAIRLMATLEGKDYFGVVNGLDGIPADECSEEYAVYATKVRKARAIIVNALGDKPLRAVQLCETPAEMWRKLYERYAGKTVANQLSVLTTLMNLKLERHQDVGDHVAELEGLVNRLAGMDMDITEPMQVAIFLVSLSNLSEYASTVSSIKTLEPDVATWSYVTMRIIDEQKALKGNVTMDKSSDGKSVLSMRSGEKSTAHEDLVCWECNQPGHIARYCPYKKKGNSTSRNSRRRYTGNYNQRGNGNSKKGSSYRVASVRVSYSTCMKNHPRTCCLVEKTNPMLSDHGVPMSNPDFDGESDKRTIGTLATLRRRVGLVTNGNQVSMRNSDIVIDSGASEHVVRERKYFSNLESSYPITVEMADGSKATTRLKGNINVKLYNGIRLMVKDVYYLPQLEMNLLSCSRLDKKAISVLFENGRCKFIDREKRNSTLGYANLRKVDMLFCAKLIEPKSNHSAMASVASRGTKADLTLWHKRMGHAGKHVISAMCSDPGYNMVVSNKTQESECETCMMASQTKSVMKGILVNSEADITIHTDICGPISTRTKGGKRYFATFTIAKSRYCEVGLLSSRSEVGKHLKEFIAWAERHGSESVKRIHSDNAKEYQALAKELKPEGITWTFSSAYTPQSNGLSERMNRTLLNKTRALLKEANMDKDFWGEAIRQAVTLYNRTSTKSLKGKSPYEVLLGRKPDNSHFRLFGCLSYVHVHREQGRGKLGDRSRHGILLAHCDGMYRVLLSGSNQVVETKHVKFDETRYPMKNGVQEITSDDSYLELDIEEENAGKVITAEEDCDERSPIEEESSTTQDEIPRYPRREHRQPERYMAGALRRAHTEDEPSLRYAMNSSEAEKWKSAIDKEITALTNLRCWDVIERPTGKKILHSKFVLKKKRNGDGTIVKYKARLVVCGNEDTENVEENFSPVIDFTLVKLFLAIAVQRKWFIRQMDFENAFVNGNLDREVIVEFPKYVYPDDVRRTSVMRLRKSLYGLREAPKIWYELLSTTLKSYGLVEMRNAPCVFTKQGVVVMCYVDDILIMSNLESEIDSLAEVVGRNLKTKDLGRPSHFLGMDFIWTDSGSLLMRQTKLITALLSNTRMESCNGISSPLTTSVDLSIKDQNPIDESFDYRSVIGSILYLAVKTRPDIAVAASMLAQHVESPSRVQQGGAKRVLRYLKATKDAALIISPGDGNQLSAYVDSSWGGEPGFGRKSRSGIIIKYGNAAVYTASVLQKCTALSSTEAEFIALSESSKTIVWLRKVLTEFGITQKATIVHQDNVGSIYWATGNTASEFAKRKHVDIRYHYVVEKVKYGEITLTKTPTEEMQSDFLTKVLHPTKFRNAVTDSGIMNYTATINREEE